jgi:large subunit ribosomal protein L21
MYAIIKSGGKQHRVEEGTIVDVARMDAKIGDEVLLDQVLLLGGEQLSVAPDALKGASVSAEVVGHSRGKKTIGLRYKPKKFFRRRVGNRSHLTQLRITEIKVPSAAVALASPSNDVNTSSGGGNGT